MGEYLLKANRLARSLLADQYEAAFIKHNAKIWGGHRCVVSPDNEVLCELFPVASSIIAYSYFTNILARKNMARIIAYTQQKKGFVRNIYNRRIKNLFKSFNTEDIIYCDAIKFSEKADQLFAKVYPEVHTKKDVESLQVNGIWIGDLIYDSYLRNFKLPSIDISSREFRKTLRDALRIFFFWDAYLKSHRVTAVVLSHCVYYESATILRLAVRQDIPVYQVNATHVYCLNRDHLRAYTEFYEYPEMFCRMSISEQQEGLQKAKERLRMRFSGEIGVDMSYSTKSAYSKEKKPRVLEKSEKTKVLIATHCFFDSPHPYGVNLFPDFYEWLSFLGSLSGKTDYEWYIKTHPDFIPANIPILERFIKRFPKFKLIPPDTSHLQLIDEGISIALSVYGTIGFEYAALGIPVIYASKCNPCVAYDFNVHPDSIPEYERILLNLNDVEIDIDFYKVYEFYYMRFIRTTKNWLFNDYDQFLSKIGGHGKQAGSVSYKEFLNQFDLKKHHAIMELLSNFITSQDYIMTQSHFGNLSN